MYNLFRISKAVFLCLLFTASVKAQTFIALPSVPGTTNDYSGGVIFEIYGKIYVGGGVYGKKLYQYNPTNQQWTIKNDLPGSVYSRSKSISFAINYKGYILGGLDV